MASQLSPHSIIAGFEDLYARDYQHFSVDRQAMWLEKIQHYIATSTAIRADERDLYQRRSNVSCKIRRLLVDLNSVVSSEQRETRTDLTIYYAELADLYKVEDEQEVLLRLRCLFKALQYKQSDAEYYLLLNEIIKSMRSSLCQYTYQIINADRRRERAKLADKAMVMISHFSKLDCHDETTPLWLVFDHVDKIKTIYTQLGSKKKVDLQELGRLTEELSIYLEDEDENLQRLRRLTEAYVTSQDHEARREGIKEIVELLQHTLRLYASRIKPAMNYTEKSRAAVRAISMIEQFFRLNQGENGVPLWLFSGHINRLKVMLVSIIDKKPCDLNELQTLVADTRGYCILYHPEILDALKSLPELVHTKRSKETDRQVLSENTNFNQLADRCEQLKALCIQEQADFMRKHHIDRDLDLRIGAYRILAKNNQPPKAFRLSRRGDVQDQKVYNEILGNRFFYKQLPSECFEQFRESLIQPVNLKNWLQALINIYREANLKASNHKKDEMGENFRTALYGYYSSLTNDELKQLQSIYKSQLYNSMIRILDDATENPASLSKKYAVYSGGRVTKYLGNINFAIRKAFEGVDLMLAQRNRNVSHPLKSPSLELSSPCLNPKRYQRIKPKILHTVRYALVSVVDRLLKNKLEFYVISKEERDSIKAMSNIKLSFWLWFNPKRFLQSVQTLYQISNQLSRDDVDKFDSYDGNIKQIYQGYLKGQASALRLYERYSRKEVQNLMQALQLVGQGQGQLLGLKHKSAEDARELYEVLDRTLQATRTILKFKYGEQKVDYVYSAHADKQQPSAVKVGYAIRRTLNRMLKDDVKCNDFNISSRLAYTPRAHRLMA